MGARLLVSLVPVCAVLIPVLIPFLPIRIPYISELKSGLCGSPPVRVHQIHDVSMPLREGATLFSRPEGLPGSHRELVSEIPRNKYYMSFLKMEAHTGTHVDAPAHFSQYHMTEEEGVRIDKINLDALIGPAYVLEIPPGVINITEGVLQGLHIPKDCERLLLKTDNSRNHLLMKPFTPNYTALTSDGSRFLAQKTKVKSVGIDCLSIATFEDNVGGHVELFHKERVIIPIEGLLLDDITPSHWYHMTCLPIKLEGAEGSPARCVLFGPKS